MNPRTVAFPLMLLALALMVFQPSPAQAQAQASSLAGFGGSGASAMGSSSPALPYSGMFNGFMPFRMAGSSSLGIAPRPAAGMAPSTRRPFQLSPSRAAMGRSPLLGPRSSSDSMAYPPGRPMSIMPPNFGYPFRQPPALINGSTSQSNMSM